MLDRLLSRGYFPRELPPGFTTESFAAAFRGGGPVPSAFSAVKPKIAEMAVHNVARAGTMRRQLGIPSPASFYPLAKLMSDNWTEIEQAVSRSDFSVTKPKVSTKSSGRAILPENPLRERAAFRAKARAGKRYLLKTDIASFYDSIYTHSIPWALLGRDRAKAEQQNCSLLGNRLDIYVRRAQSNQTRGIPTGPDTSFVLAEVLLGALDEDLKERLQLDDLPGFRSVDDYELCFESLSDAERALAAIQSILQGYELDVTALKTDIIKLPHWLDEPWTVNLLSHVLPGEKDCTQKAQILNFFTLTFSLTIENPKASVIRFALGQRMQKVRVSLDSWEPYQQLLLQCAVTESDTLSYVVSELEKYALKKYPMDRKLIGAALNEVVRKESPVGLGNAVAWALWGLLLFEIPLTKPAAAALQNLDDSIAALIAFDMKTRGFAEELDLTNWIRLISAGELYSRHWLLAFEAPAHGWSLPGAADPVGSDSVFGFLRNQDVQFYMPPDTIAKRLEDPFDLDFVLELLEEQEEDQDEDPDEYFLHARS